MLARAYVPMWVAVGGFLVAGVGVALLLGTVGGGSNGGGGRWTRVLIVGLAFVTGAVSTVSSCV